MGLQEGRRMGDVSPSWNRESQEDFRIRGIFFSPCCQENQTNKRTKRKSALKSRCRGDRKCKRPPPGELIAPLFSASQLLVLPNLTQLQGITDCTETKRLKQSIGNVAGTRKWTLDSGLVQESWAPVHSCQVAHIQMCAFWTHCEFNWIDLQACGDDRLI